MSVSVRASVCVSASIAPYTYLCIRAYAYLYTLVDTKESCHVMSCQVVSYRDILTPRSSSLI